MFLRRALQRQALRGFLYSLQSTCSADSIFPREMPRELLPRKGMQGQD